MADATFAHQTVTAFMCVVFWMEDNGWMASLKVGVAHWIACIIVTAPVVYNSTLGCHVQSQHAGDDGEQGHCTDADLAFVQCRAAKSPTIGVWSCGRRTKQGWVEQPFLCQLCHMHERLITTDFPCARRVTDNSS